jgi:hypothetical protein
MSDVALHHAVAQTLLGQFVGAPGAREEPTLVAPRLKLDQVSAGDGSFVEFHPQVPLDT